MLLSLPALELHRFERSCCFRLLLAVTAAVAAEHEAEPESVAPAAEVAAEHGYALPAFNVNNMEQIQAIMAAAEETRLLRQREAEQERRSRR